MFLIRKSSIHASMTPLVLDLVHSVPLTKSCARKQPYIVYTRTQIAVHAMNKCIIIFILIIIQYWILTLNCI